MVSYLILAKIIDKELFTKYINGHIPTISKFGGKVIFRSVSNLSIIGNNNWDAIAIQEWENTESFDKWWNSDEYKQWSEIRDKAAIIDIIKCENLNT